MKTTILSLVSFLALGFAGVAHAGEGAARRGQVNVQAAATKAVVAGPAVIKVYSGFSGAKVFVADAASATDADCVAAAGRASGTTLAADRDRARLRGRGSGRLRREHGQAGRAALARAVGHAGARAPRAAIARPQDIWCPQHDSNAQPPRSLLWVLHH